ncbi:hypothetical protein [Paenibacillus sp. NFR01]|uniref:hypothetical protein n=1 Tax=Paenibacillus sp. NFR01 TaxID=1566279 RepID=UPI001113EFEE|nr:hypothetical protein [Paenibacillus sp. NFR01]
MLLGVIIIWTAGGCAADLGNGDSGSAAGSQGPAFSLMIGDAERSGSSARQVGEAYMHGISLMELLKSSGIVTFEGNEIKEVNRISLTGGFEWEIQLNGKKTSNWNAGISRDDSITIVALPDAYHKDARPVILTVNGGSGQLELTHSYVYPYTDDLTVRGLLKNSGIVAFDESGKTVAQVLDYSPLTTERWKLKLNGKGLLDSGIDMKLRPQDELEIALVPR